MKKYLSLLVVFLMVFVLGNHLAQARDGEDDSSDDIKIETSGKIEIETEDNDSDEDESMSEEDKNDDSDEDSDDDSVSDSDKNDDSTDDVNDSDDDGLDDSKDVKNRREEMKRLFEDKREEFKKQIETVREQTKTKMEALRESIKNEKDVTKAKVKELRIESRERVLERFENAIVRMSELKDRVNAQILKLEAKGVNVVNAKNFVATSETKLTAARNKIVEINALLVISINELTLENKTKLITLAKETQALIIETHTALKEAVKSLRAEVKIKMEADASVNE